MRHARWLGHALLLVLPALVVACDSPEVRNDTVSVVVTPPKMSSGSNAVVASATPTPVTAEAFRQDRIERGVAAPHAVLKLPPGALRAIPSDFTPPPLPPELLDDGGLTPLPLRRASPTETPK